MAVDTRTRAVEDTVAKVNNELAVGEDLPFQRRWWKFEHAVWIFLAFLVLLDVLGVFGRGPLSKAHKEAPDDALTMQYEWVERFGTPSILTLHFSPQAVQNGKIEIWVSDAIIKELGNQRIIPQPATSATGEGGVVYSFPSTGKPNSVEFALEPSKLGQTRFSVRLIGHGTVTEPEDTLYADVFVMP